MADKQNDPKDLAAKQADTFTREAKKVEPHQSENRVTTSTEGKVETTTKEK